MRASNACLCREDCAPDDDVFAPEQQVFCHDPVMRRTMGSGHKTTCFLSDHDPSLHEQPRTRLDTVGTYRAR